MALKQARSLIGRGLNEEALVELEDEEDNAIVCLLRGSALHRLRRYKDAEESLRKVTQLDRFNTVALRGLTRLYFDTKNPKDYMDATISLLEALQKSDDLTGAGDVLKKAMQARKKFHDQEMDERLLILQLPGSPVYDWLASDLPPLQPTLAQLVGMREKKLQSELSNIKSRARMNVSMTVERTNTEYLRAYQSSGLDELYTLQTQTSDVDSDRRVAEAKLLDVKYAILRLSPKKDKKPQMCKDLVDGMVLFEALNPLAYTLHWDWLDISDYSQLEHSQVTQFIQMFPTHTVSRKLDAFLHCPLNPWSSKELWPTNELLEHFSTPDSDSILCGRVSAEYMVMAQEWDRAIDISKEYLTLIQSQSNSLALEFPHTERNLMVSLGTAYIHFQAPRNHPLASELFAAVLETENDNPQALVGQAQILIERNETDKAELILRKVLNSHKHHNQALGELGWCLITNSNDEDIQTGKDLLFQALNHEYNSYFRAQIRWRIGYAAWKTGETNDAFDSFLASLRELPTYAPSFSYLGLIYETRGDNTRSYKCFFKAIELDATQTIAAEHLSRNFAEQGQWDLVRLVAANVVNAVSNKAAWPYRALGIAALNEQRWKDAVAYFQRCLRLDPADSDSWVGLGEAYIASGRYNSAEKALKRALEINPQSFPAHYVLSRAQVAVLDFPAAANSITVARNLFVGASPALAFAAVDDSVLAAEWYLTRSELGAAVDAANAALALCEEELLRDPSLYRIWSGASRALSVVSRIGKCECQRRLRPRDKLFHVEKQSSSSDIKLDAFRIAEIALSKAENAPKQLRAELCFNAGLSAHAAMKNTIPFFQRAIIYNRRKPNYWIAYGMVLIHINPVVSQHCLIRALSLDGRCSAAWSTLGVLYLDNGDYGLASEALDRALAIDADCATAWVGQALAEHKNKPAKYIARLLNQAALLDAPIVALPLGLSAYCSEKEGQHSPISEPIAALEKLLELEPEHTLGRKLSALLLERHGNYADALVRSDDLSGKRRCQLALGNWGEAQNLGDDIDLESLIVAGLAHYFAGQFEGALELFLAALEVDRCSSSVVSLLVQVLWSQGTNEAQDAAVEQIWTALDRTPGDLTLTLLLGVIGILTEDTEVAEAALDELRQSLPGLKGKDLASACLVISRIESSSQVFRRAVIMRSPGTYALWKSIDPEQALEYAKSKQLPTTVISEAYALVGGIENSRRAVFMSPVSSKSWSSLKSCLLD